MAQPFNGTNYFAQHMSAPQIIQGTPNYNVEVGEGNNPPGDYFPAGYLPMAVSENRIGGHFYSLMPGQVVTLDTTKRLINAGLILDKPVADGSRKLKYTQADLDAGVRDASGLACTVGNTVYKSMVDNGLDIAGASNGAPIGIMRYSALGASGSDPSDPSTYYTHSYDTGGAKAFTRWGYIQVPVVEVNTRAEAISQTNSYRIALYPNGALVFKKGGSTVSLTQKPNPTLFTDTASANNEPNQFAMVGRTIFFNGVPNTTTWTVEYTPVIKTAFTSLVVDYGATVTAANEKGMKDYLMQTTGFNVNGSFQLTGSAGCSTEKIGRVLDVKQASSKDLALVRTYFRDFGLWQEAPGSATDGRNAILSIANAPKYVARIAVNFNVQSF